MAVFGLIDGNSFYCSAERAFAPELRGIPLVVLSNNDGCAIARTTEAKAMGIKMGEPWHLALRRPACKQVEWRSSNYPLYGDMSRRMYEVLATRVPQVEPYSIDEMFLDLTGLPDLENFCRRLRDDVRRLAKIPTCVGIGPTKTIAKLANRIAKDDFALRGICDLRDDAMRATYYAESPISMVWGIGGKTVEKLNRLGIYSIADFVKLMPEQVRELLTVTGARVQAELRGQSDIAAGMRCIARRLRPCGICRRVWQADRRRLRVDPQWMALRNHRDFHPRHHHFLFAIQQAATGEQPHRQHQCSATSDFQFRFHQSDLGLGGGKQALR